jgi:hypothetical protein
MCMVDALVMVHVVSVFGICWYRLITGYWYRLV